MSTRSATPFQKEISGTFDHPINIGVKSPFKHYQVGRQTNAWTQKYMSPDRLLLEETSAAVQHVQETLGRETTSIRPGTSSTTRRLTSARLMPLHPVIANGPTMEQCRGILAGTRPLSTKRTLNRLPIRSNGLHLHGPIHKTWKSAQNINTHHKMDRKRLPTFVGQKHSGVDMSDYVEFSRSRFGDSSTDSRLDDSGLSSMKLPNRSNKGGDHEIFSARPKMSKREPSPSVRISLNDLHSLNASEPKSSLSSARSMSRISSARYGSHTIHSGSWLDLEKKAKRGDTGLVVYGHATGSAGEGTPQSGGSATQLSQSAIMEVMQELKKTESENKKIMNHRDEMSDGESDLSLCLTQCQVRFSSRRLPRYERRRAQSARPWLHPIDEDDDRRKYRSRSAGAILHPPADLPDRQVVVTPRESKPAAKVKSMLMSLFNIGASDVPEPEQKSSLRYNLTLYQMIHPDIQSSVTGDWDIPTKIAKNTVHMEDDGRAVPGMGAYRSRTNQELVNVVKSQLSLRANQTSDDKNYFAALTSNPLINSFINAKPERGYVYYFAYGSDMNEKRFSSMIGRSVNFDAPTWVLLYGFKLQPAPYKEDISESHPRLEFCARSAVNGRLYAITNQESLKLEGNLGVLQKFRRLVLPVWLLTRNVVEPSLAQYCLPAIVYMDASIKLPV